MKFSIFNSIIKLSSKTSLLYNSLSDKYILYKNAFSINDSLLSVENKLHLILKNSGFIINDTVDEISLIKEINQDSILNEDVFHLIVNSTLECNFRCWYCYETHSSKLFMTDETLEKVKLFIFDKAKSIKKLNLSFFGGEPLLEYNKIVKPLILYTDAICKTKDVKYNVSFTTNGFFLDEEMISFFKNYNASLFQITLDGGKEFHNKTRVSRKKDSYETIVENIKLLLENRINVILRINSTATNVDSVIDIISSMKDITFEMKKYLRINFKQVWQDDSDITEKKNSLIEQFVINGIDASLGMYDNLRRPCYADLKNSAIINYNGDIYKCTAVDFVNTIRDGFLDVNGKLIEENNRLNIRLDSKFKNASCLECRILPLCNGGCSQKALNSFGKEYCICNYDESQKDEIIMSRFRYNISNNPNW